MSAIEDRLRAAARAAADTVAPGSAPPLHLPGHEHGHRPARGRGTGPGRRWPGWVAPLTAAAAVAVVVAGTLMATKLASAHLPAHRAGTARGHAGPGTVRLRRAPAPADAGLPPYAVGLAPGPLAGRSNRALVRATASGAVLASIVPPRPYRSFVWVTAAADDRTFVLAAQSGDPVPPPAGGPMQGATKFFLLRLDPAGGTARLTALPIPAVPDQPGQGSIVGSIALSPDGRNLAVVLETRRPVIKIFDVRDGSAREWTGSRPADQLAADRLGSTALSWTADGRTLAVDQWRNLSINVLLLDTTTPGGDLGSARQVMSFANWPSGSVSGSAIISPDATKIIAMAVTASATQEQANEFSTRTGAPLGSVVRLHYRHGAVTGWPTVVWSDPSGSTLIVSVTRPADGPSYHGDLTPMVIGVVTHGHFDPLPGIPAGEMLAW